jgi:phosphopantetheinyl transferase (holo-ACP synthase)
MREVLRSPVDAPEIGLVELWTVKEAFLKSIGEGFATPRGFGVLSLLECALGERVDDWRTIAIRDARTGVRTIAWTRRVGDHVLSVVGGDSPDTAPRLERVTLA